MTVDGNDPARWTELMGHGRDEPRRILARRALTIPLYVLLLGLLLALFPVLLPLAVVSDLIRRSGWVGLRFLAFLLLYFSCEILGIVTSFLLWLARGPWISRDTERYLRLNFALQRWWARSLAGGAFHIFSLQLEMEGMRDFSKRPILLFVRHASTVDTVLPSLLIMVPQGVMLRHVIKRELLLDPCLDIVGNRLPNYFVRRGGGDSRKEIEAVGRLMDHLGPGQGVLTYPEGTRFTPRKRERALRRLEEAGDAEHLERARRMTRCLPPRLGGPLTMLERNTGADAVFCVHTGLEHTVSLGQLWRGGMVRARVRVKFWVVPYEEIPRGREALAEWLWDQWSAVSDWLDEHQEDRG